MNAPKAGSRSTGLSSASSPTKHNARNDRRHRSFQLPSPVPTSPVIARGEAPAPVSRKSLVTPGWFPKEGPQPFLWSFQGGLGGIRNPPRIFLRGSGGVFFQFGKNTSPYAAKHPWRPRLVNRPRHAESSCPTEFCRDENPAGLPQRPRSVDLPPIFPLAILEDCVKLLSEATAPHGAARR